MRRTAQLFQDILLWTNENQRKIGCNDEAGREKICNTHRAQPSSAQTAQILKPYVCAGRQPCFVHIAMISSPHVCAGRHDVRDQDHCLAAWGYLRVQRIQFVCHRNCLPVADSIHHWVPIWGEGCSLFTGADGTAFKDKNFKKALRRWNQSCGGDNSFDLVMKNVCIDQLWPSRTLSDLAWQPVTVFVQRESIDCQSA